MPSESSPSETTQKAPNSSAASHDVTDEMSPKEARDSALMVFTGADHLDSLCIECTRTADPRRKAGTEYRPHFVGTTVSAP